MLKVNHACSIVCNDLYARIHIGLLYIDGKGLAEKNLCMVVVKFLLVEHLVAVLAWDPCMGWWHDGGAGGWSGLSLVRSRKVQLG